MAIVKVKRDGSGSYRHQEFFSAAVVELEQEKIPQVKYCADDSDDDYKHAEVECEILKIGDVKCSVPYDMYDLASLKEVLSLETWNSCLSEEERFTLSAYLPDMDQETFWLMMKELLSGENVFFGSPLDIFFQRLKGGFYSLQVSQFREALQSMHRRGYYHSLRLYHENLNYTLMDMKKAWSGCLPSIDVKERVRIWNKRRFPKPICLVDLNAFPADEEVWTVVDKNISSPTQKKKKKFTDNRVLDILPGFSGGESLPLPKTEPKGVLKIKSTSNSTMQYFPCDLWGQLRPTPKGVLKIKRRSESRAEGLMPLQPILVETSCLPTFQLSPEQSAGTWDMDNVHKELFYPHQKALGEKLTGSFDLASVVNGLPKGQLVHKKIRPLNGLQNLERKKPRKMKLYNDAEVQGLLVKGIQNTDSFSHDISEVRKRDSESHCERLGQPLPDPIELNPSALVHSQEKRLITSLASGIISMNSGVGAEENGSFGKSFDQLEHKQRDISSKGLLKPSEKPAIGDVPRGVMLPLTYKRKKGHSKHKSMGSIQPPIEEASIESRMASMKVRAIWRKQNL